MNSCAFWDQVYGTEDPEDLIIPNVWSGVIGADVPRGSALDVGCGFGHNTSTLTSMGFNAYGIDISVVAITRAAEIYHESSFFHDDFLSITGDFGLVLSTFSTPTEYGVLEQFIAQLLSSVSPGGHLLFVEWSHSSLSQWGLSDQASAFQQIESLTEKWSLIAKIENEMMLSPIGSSYSGNYDLLFLQKPD